MEYLTGIHALNLPCDLETSGDWHACALAWKELTLRDSCASVFGEWGISICSPIDIPEHAGSSFNIANHLRACADLLEQSQFAVAQGMREDFICNDSYNEELFSRVALLQDAPNWESVHRFMSREYGRAWIEYRGHVHAMV